MKDIYIQLFHAIKNHYIQGYICPHFIFTPFVFSLGEFKTRRKHSHVRANSKWGKTICKGKRATTKKPWRENCFVYSMSKTYPVEWYDLLKMCRLCTWEPATQVLPSKTEYELNTEANLHLFWRLSMWILQTTTIFTGQSDGVSWIFMMVQGEPWQQC